MPEETQSGENSSVLIKHLRPQNLLSFGPDFPGIELRPLNVLIGANGSGKSNFLQALGLLKAMPNDLQRFFNAGGGASRWFHSAGEVKNLQITAELERKQSQSKMSHFTDIAGLIGSCIVTQETIQIANQDEGDVFWRLINEGKFRSAGEVTSSPLHSTQSVLAQRRDPEAFPEISFLQDSYNGISIYSDWRQGRNNLVKGVHDTAGRSDRLEEDFSNLPMFLGALELLPSVKAGISDRLKDVYEEVTGYTVLPLADHVELRIIEGDFTVPSSRVSDGTLRYLCLLALLLQPTPPPLICIEEPELGLHPDLIVNVARLLKEASTRTQIIITTHSEVLVDALNDSPEDIVVCEKVDGQTQMKRLSPDYLAPWLENYSLGDLWTRGTLGGNRW